MKAAFGRPSFFYRIQTMIYSSSQLLDKFNAYLLRLSLDRNPKGLYEPIIYELSLGGKRLRPILMMFAYLLYKDDVDAILPQATGLEIYHNFTLLHDDVMDRSALRRGKPTVHKVWNENTAILSGDAMTILAYQLMCQCRVPYINKVLSVFSKTALEICEGQQYDMDFEVRDNVSIEEYIEMIRLKTSVLLAGALRIGAILADASEEEQQKLYDFGIKIGLAFQLQDDYLDVYGDSKVFGKPIGGDILENKKTFMLISALSLSKEKQQQEMMRWIRAKDFNSEEKIEAITSIYNQLGIGDLAVENIKTLYSEGLSILSSINGREEYKSELEKLANHLMKRNM